MTALVKPELTQVIQEAASVLDMIDMFAIIDDADQADAVLALRRVKAQIADLEKQRKFLVSPLKRHCKDIDALYRGPRRTLELAEAQLKDKIGSYQLAQNQAHTEAYKLAAAEHVAGNHAEAAAAIVQAESHRTVPEEGTSTTLYWATQITDEEAVPRGWCSPDEARIARLARSSPTDSDPPEIAGVTFTLKTRITVRQ